MTAPPLPEALRACAAGICKARNRRQAIAHTTGHTKLKPDRKDEKVS